MGLVALIFKTTSDRIDKLEEWKDSRPRVEEIVTFTKHIEICKMNTHEMKQFINDKIADIKSDIADLKQDIKKFNGGK